MIAKQNEELPEEIFEEAPSPQEDIGYQKEEESIKFDDKEIMPEQSYNQIAPSYNPSDVESKIQEVAELIVDEKWGDLTKKLGNLGLWKSRVETEITAIKQEILRMQGSFQNLQNAIAGKLNDYNQNIINVNSEMKALEGVLQKIIEPLSQNIKELNRISNDLKSASKSKK